MKPQNSFYKKGAVTRNRAKLFHKILVEECENLYRIKREKRIVFACGTGRRNFCLQKSTETLGTYIAKRKEYNKKLHICGKRSNYFKTDSKYITWLDINTHPTDTRTLILFLKDMRYYLPLNIRKLYPAEYENEKNYLFLEETVYSPVSNRKLQYFQNPKISEGSLASRKRKNER